jgi:choline-sulfatase
LRILFLDLDTVRPDHLGCYGYQRNTSPNIDRIAGEGVRFTNYHCSDAPCLPSRAALMSGRFGIHTGVVGHGGTAADMRIEGKARGFRDLVGSEGLAATIKSAGLRTASISPFADRHAAWWFNAGFTETIDTGKGGMESAEEVTPAVLKWIEANADSDDWFLHVNYWDAHTPYRAPEEFGNPFAEDPLPEWLTEEVLSRHRSMAGPHGAREIMMFHSTPDPNYPRHPGELRDMTDVRQMIDGYDCGIRYMDQHIGKLLSALANKGVLGDLIVVITSDHGENMGELGIYGEHATADYPTTRIPLIISWPRVTKESANEGLHYNVDLLPTLAEMLGARAGDSWDGESFAGAIRGEVCEGREFLVVSQCAHVCQRAVRFDNWIYIRTYHDGYHLFPEEMLFGLESDPHEQHDIADQHPDVCGRASRYLLQWQLETMKSSPSDVDPLWTVIREGGPMHARGMLQSYCERLKTTERADAVPELQKRHPSEFHET